MSCRIKTKALSMTSYSNKHCECYLFHFFTIWFICFLFCLLSNALTVWKASETRATAMASRSDPSGTAQPPHVFWPAGGGSTSEELDVRSFLSSLMEENSTAERCYHSHSRSSVLQGLPFGGVPTVLAINVVLWLVMLHLLRSKTAQKPI